jgi:hypothetical protein
MIVCPNCNHQNPDGATQCEACYTPLPANVTCPNCGGTVQADAKFCAHCGFDLTAATTPMANGGFSAMSPNDDDFLPDLPEPEPLVEPDPLVVGSTASPGDDELPTDFDSIDLDQLDLDQLDLNLNQTFANVPTVREPNPQKPLPPQPIAAKGSATQLQVQLASLLHIRTNTVVELPTNLAVIHIGKPNDRVPPDVDVSGFPDSEVVSRIHADIRNEADTYYLEDVGSANGTYVNNLPLPKGNRHRLRHGDKISLGKGDKVSFLFQLS